MTTTRLTSIPAATGSQDKLGNGGTPPPTRLGPEGARPVRVQSANPLRVAVIGAGRMGQHHLHAIGRLHDRAMVVGLVDPAPGRAEELRMAGIEIPVYPDLSSLMEVGAVDLAHICTTPETHLTVAREALAAGCHLYIEKPVADSAAAAARLLDEAAAQGLRVCAGHQLLYERPAREARALLPALGRIVHLESYFSFRTVRWMQGGRVPLSADRQLLDILPHPVYLLLEFLRESLPEGEVSVDTVRVGPRGTVHALIRRGSLCGSLTVTLDGRPVESYLRFVGTNGTLHADFVRGTLQRLLGPGTSGIDKAANPFRLARQLVGGTTAALLGRLRRRQYSYPGLEELFSAFYQSIQENGPAPIAEESILETVRICELINKAMQVRPERMISEDAIAATDAAPVNSLGPNGSPGESMICITGGTGFLGAEVVRILAREGLPVLCLARRTPPAWEQEPGVEYREWDLGEPPARNILQGVKTIIHCAAATAGGFDEHQRNSVNAVEHLARAAAEAGVGEIIHISSLAVLDEPSDATMVDESSPVLAEPRGNGPYAWGKLESEVVLQHLADELEIRIRVIRPGAIIDLTDFEPPGRLGKRIGNLFIAVGSRAEQIGTVDLGFAARTVAWASRNFDDLPEVLHLLDPELPTRQQLVSLLRRSNPDLRVLWVPRPLLYPLSILAVVLQKTLRRGSPPIDPARVFGRQHYSTSGITALGPMIQGGARSGL